MKLTYTDGAIGIGINSKSAALAAIATRAAAVGFYVSDTRADDGTYWIPSIGKWRSINQINEVVSERESDE